jgi:hypothetical protein
MALLLTGGLLLLLLEQGGLETWAPASPWPAFYRMGQALLALGLLAAVPVWRVPGLVALGRSSLGIYVAHLVLLYGWAGDPGLVASWAHRLSLPWAIGLASLVLAAATGGSVRAPLGARPAGGEHGLPQWAALGKLGPDAREIPRALEPGPDAAAGPLENQRLALERASAPERLLHRQEPLGPLVRGGRAAR